MKNKIHFQIRDEIEKESDETTNSRVIKQFKNDVSLRISIICYNCVANFCFSFCEGWDREPEME